MLSEPTAENQQDTSECQTFKKLRHVQISATLSVMAFTFLILEASWSLGIVRISES